ncbi:MAG TPA: hypothetical protein PLR77_07665 [Caldisericia bacterium]|nr:hypothetical protein [Caldisericia bacterium]
MKQLRLLMSILCAFSCLVLPSQGKPSVAVPLAGPEWSRLADNLILAQMAM